MLGPQPDPQPLAPPKDVTDGNPCQMGASDRGRDGVCLYQTTACTLHSAAHTPTLNPLTFRTCGRNQDSLGRGSEGYGTEEECVLSDPQGESDADADIEDTDCRLQEPGGLQRISSRRRKRPRPTRQDTTESEDDGGRSQRTPHWPLRLSPQRTHSRPILEESVSQVRPLVIRPARVEVQAGSEPARWSPRLHLLLLLLLPLSLLLLVLSLLFRPWAGA